MDNKAEEKKCTMCRINRVKDGEEFCTICKERQERIKQGKVIINFQEDTLRTSRKKPVKVKRGWINNFRSLERAEKKEILALAVKYNEKDKKFLTTEGVFGINVSVDKIREFEAELKNYFNLRIYYPS